MTICFVCLRMTAGVLPWTSKYNPFSVTALKDRWPRWWRTTLYSWRVPYCGPEHVAEIACLIKRICVCLTCVRLGVYVRLGVESLQVNWKNSCGCSSASMWSQYCETVSGFELVPCNGRYKNRMLNFVREVIRPNLVRETERGVLQFLLILSRKFAGQYAE